MSLGQNWGNKFLLLKFYRALKSNWDFWDRTSIFEIYFRSFNLIMKIYMSAQLRKLWCSISKDCWKPKSINETIRLCGLLHSYILTVKCVTNGGNVNDKKEEGRMDVWKSELSILTHMSMINIVDGILFALNRNDIRHILDGWSGDAFYVLPTQL